MPEHTVWCIYITTCLFSDSLLWLFDQHLSLHINMSVLWENNHNLSLKKDYDFSVTKDFWMNGFKEILMRLIAWRVKMEKLNKHYYM